MSKRFWEIVNYKSQGAELKIYGPIVSEHSWFENGDPVTANDFAKDLEGLGGKDVTVRINSPGGDIFAAHAIHNQLRAYSGNVTVVIDGLCASAATVVAMAGKKILMPTNALFMIHNPAMGLGDYYSAEDLSKVINALNGAKDSIIAAYKKRCKLSEAELSKLMDEETWMGAQECLAKGFIDEIDGEVTAMRNGNQLVINNLAVDMTKFKNLGNFTNNFMEVSNMNKLDVILDKISKFLDAPVVSEPNAVTASNPVAVTASDPVASVTEVVNAERQRVKALEAFDPKDNAMVKAIIDHAKESGQTIDQIKPILDIVVAKSGNAKAEELVKNMVQDNKESGTEQIISGAKNEDDLAKAAEDKAMQSFIDALNKGGK